LADPGEAARHHLAAGEPDLAHRTALEASAAAERPGDRARHLALAAACATGDAADELRLRAADELIATGDAAQAAALAGAVEATDPTMRARAGLQAARASFALGRGDESRKMLEEALELVRGDRSELEVRLQLELIHQAGFGETGFVLESAREALALAELVGAHVARAEFKVGFGYYWSGSALSLDYLRRARRAARREGDIELELDALLALVSALHPFGQPEKARRLAEVGAARARRLGLRRWELNFRWVAARLSYLVYGEFARAAAELDELARDPAFTYPDRAQLDADRAVSQACAGHADEAFSTLLEAAEAGTSWGADVLDWAEAEVAWHAGRANRCLAAAARLLAGEPRPMQLAGAAFRDWALLDLGHPAGPVPPDVPSSLYDTALLESSGLAALGRGGARRAEKLLDDAAAAWSASGVLFPQWRSQWGAAIAAEHAGFVTRARERLLALEEVGEDYGAEAFLRRVRKSLRRLGVRRTVRRERKVGSLSGRERVVLTLVGTGLTTAQVAARLGIAPSTANTLVRSAMRKLGASTRMQATVLAGPQGPSSGGRSVIALDNRAAARALRDASRRELIIVSGWCPPNGRHAVCYGHVDSASDLRAAVMAAARGSRLIVEISAESGLLEGLVEDLQRIGDVEVRTTFGKEWLAPDEQRLLELLSKGVSVTAAAQRLHISRRTANRRLAHARMTLNVNSNTEAVLQIARDR
jgi:DNA-binding NarL/FixJ family response regulator